MFDWVLNAPLSLKLVYLVRRIVKNLGLVLLEDTSNLAGTGFIGKISLSQLLLLVCYMKVT